jgi:hypothetical protein
MQQIIAVVVLMLACGCASQQVVHKPNADPSTSPPTERPTATAIVHEGGEGSSSEKAVVVKGAQSENPSGEDSAIISKNTGSEDLSTMSANEIAQKLSNPNTPLASLTLRTQWIHWNGDLPGADGVDSGLFLFQPAFPFPVSKTSTVSFRPAFNYLIDQPVFDPNSGRMESETGFGDMGFDLAYGTTSKSGLLTRFGLAGNIPIGADELSNDTWALGPEFLLGVKRAYGVFGLFPSHQWDVSGPAQINRTTIQPIVVFLPGNAWAFGSNPIISYDWVDEQWTIPLQLFVGKTVKFGGVPLRLGLEANYFVEQPAALGQELMLAFNITPVLPNIFAKLLGLGE